MERRNLAALVRPLIRMAPVAPLLFALVNASIAQAPPDPATGLDRPADSSQARAWSSWAAEHGASVEALGDGRILRVAPTQRAGAAATREAVAATVARFDEVFGKEEAPTAPVVLLDLDDRGQFGAAIDELARQNPYAESWLRSIAAAPRDFVLEDPVVGALAPVARADEREEWDPLNELVHRAAHLLLVQRFGHQPHWLRVGLCWTIEQDVRGTIYCFPGRNDFVSVDDHDGWSSELTALYKAKTARPITLADLGLLSRGRYDARSAARAWGAARFLVEREREALPKILADLKLAWNEQSIETHADGTWVRKPDFELDPSAQTVVFERHTGADLWKRMSDAFRDARRLVPPSVKASVKPTRR